MREGEAEYFRQQLAFFEAVKPRPICAGCPDGAFDRAISIWLDEFAAQLAADTGDRWGTCRPHGLVEDAPRGELSPSGSWTVRALVTIDDPTESPRVKRLVFGPPKELSPISVVKWATPRNIVPAEAPAADPVPMPARTVEDQLAELRDQVRLYHERTMVSYGTITRMLQRITVLVVHYGATPIDAELTIPWLGTFTLRIVKPTEIPVSERDPRGQDVGQKRPS